jgi:hypothetical protein
MSRRGTRGVNQWCHAAPAAGSLALALLAVCCSSTATTTGTDTAQHGLSASGGLTDLFTGSSAKAPQTPAGAQPDANCPAVEVRRGASTLTIAPPGDKTTMTLQYQGEFTREARECSVVNGMMYMKIGIEGRVVVGPAGAPGEVNVPLRMAVVQVSPNGSKPVMTKFIIIPVAVTSREAPTNFSHVEDALSFPVPTPTALLDDYIVYVGFDPGSAQAQAQAKEPPKAKPKLKPKPPTANAG